MSSTVSGGGSAPSSSSEPKKKFGKNLNKLTKPPPPPPSAVSSRGGPASSRNGLLVLSTKRSSGGSASSNLLSKLSGGAAPRPLNTPSLRSESGGTGSDNTSGKLFHEGSGWGLSTATSVSASPADVSAQQQHAWHVDEKVPVSASIPQPQQLSQPSVPVLAPKGGISARYSSYPSKASTRWGDMDDFADERTPSNNYHRSSSAPISYSGNSHTMPQPNSKCDQKKRLGAPPGLGPSMERDRGDSHMLSPNRNSVTRQNSQTGDQNTHPTTVPNTHEKHVSNSFYGNGDTSAALLQNVEQGGSTEWQNSPQPLVNKHQPSITAGKDLTEKRRHQQPQQLSTDISGDSTDVVMTTSSLSSMNSTSVKSNSADGKVDVDDQVKYMARLARERAEARRLEEEKRMNEQRERAARRLKELEDKMSTPPPPKQPPPTNGRQTKVQGSSSWRHNAKSMTNATSNGQNSEIILERLGRSKNNGDETMPGGNPATAAITGQTSNANSRNLFDPNGGRSYSSLVVGSTNADKDKHLSGSAEEVRHVPKQQQSTSYLKQKQIPTNSHHNVHPHMQLIPHAPLMDEHPPPIAIIQLSSYEDQDRGERSQARAGPRMLFDPKSGSMVEAPSFDKRTHIKSHVDDNNVASGPTGKGRKERKQKNRKNDKERLLSSMESMSLVTKKRETLDPNLSLDNSRHFILDDSPSTGPAEEADHKQSRRQRKKDDGIVHRTGRERKRGEKDKRPIHDTSNSSTVNGAKGSQTADNMMPPLSARRSLHGGRGGRQSVVAEYRMPRTRGVLYKMDNRGEYVCADGCDADQGYGSHSVPGGRVRNPAAHAQYLRSEQQKIKQQTETATGKIGKKISPIRNGETQSQHIISATADYSSVNFSSQASAESMTPARHVQPQQRNENHHREIAEFDQAGITFPTHMQQQVQPENSYASSLGQPKAIDIESDAYFLPSINLKGNEPISILTDGSESPTLQASANPWRPSEAALAAAAAAAASQSKTVDVDTQREATVSAADRIDSFTLNDDDDVSQHSSSFVGLGFDPTENMDSVMMSPSLRSEADDEPVGLTNLSLDEAGSPSIGNPFTSLSSPNRYLGTATWGGSSLHTTSPGASLGMGLGWNLLGTANKAETTPSSQHTPNNVQQPAVASFLSLSPMSSSNQDGSNTWGRSAFGGGLGNLGGSTFGSSGHLHSEENRKNR
eukprot:CAMPEP_0195509106 /NCGR_PEP_ID=MMETSP0794_2-20130614/2126_1 /TAXON_ID=515487 /ORGANISM="Stephanopyxis turris, Strain CCMP 815" /LENGTH=1194 /DNA_ID=CAMNT_0040636239 /DNA_START=379 /DNA_END=3963 /DNA_ORIENTATION=-